MDATFQEPAEMELTTCQSGASVLITSKTGEGRILSSPRYSKTYSQDSHDKLPEKDFKLYLTWEKRVQFVASRVIMPSQGRKQALNELHVTHPGVSRMKTLVRGYPWWPHMVCRF